MTTPISTGGTCLPVSQQLVQMLNNELVKAHPTINPLTDLEAITFNFRDPGYSAETGGYHPVEIRISRNGTGFTVDYITDFSYVGQGGYAELAKEIDFDFQADVCEVRFCPVMPLEQADELYQTFEENFLSYYEMKAFTVEITLEPQV